MYLLLPFCLVLVLKSSHCRFVPNSEPFDLQRYGSNPQPFQADRTPLNDFRAPDNYQYYHPSRRPQRNVQDPVGIVYGNGKPIGFLQPYGRVYQMTSEELANNQPTKREYVDIFYPVPKQAVEQDDNGEAVLTGEQTSNKYNSEYPSVLTNFKIDSRLKNKEPPPRRAFEKEFQVKSVAKREVESKGMTKENLDKLKNALLNYEENPEGMANVQEILGEMGFAEMKEKDEEGGLQKRESSQEEDEDMEKGVNAIRLVKETHDVEKRKSKKQSKRKEATAKEGESENEKDSVADEEYEDEEEGKAREKRDDSSPQPQNSELMEKLEKSGDLTVSGNKSPLASSGGESPRESKQKNDKESESEEERVAREIQAKIDAIKDQVKRQISESKEKQKEKGDRKKRDVNNLLSEENLQIDPQYNTEGDDQTRHVRRKRGVDPPPSVAPHELQKRAANAPYRDEDVEVDEEDDEFEDDGFDDRTAALISNGRHPRVVEDLEWEDSILYDSVGDQFVRKKRNSADRAMRHLGAVRERSQMPKGYPKSDEGSLKGAQDKLQQIADMSDVDLFGALPEGYEGELARYKRVKRGPSEDGT